MATYDDNLLKEREVRIVSDRESRERERKRELERFKELSKKYKEEAKQNKTIKELRDRFHSKNPFNIYKINGTHFMYLIGGMGILIPQLCIFFLPLIEILNLLYLELSGKRIKMIFFDDGFMLVAYLFVCGIAFMPVAKICFALKIHIPLMYAKYFVKYTIYNIAIYPFDMLFTNIYKLISPKHIKERKVAKEKARIDSILANLTPKQKEGYGMIKILFEQYQSNKANEKVKFIKLAKEAIRLYNASFSTYYDVYIFYENKIIKEYNLPKECRIAWAKAGRWANDSIKQYLQG